MNSDQLFWVNLWKSIMIGIVVIVSISLLYLYFDHINMIEGGYQEDTIQGSNQIVWRKIKQ